jgi:hypothetical protein
MCPTAALATFVYWGIEKWLRVHPALLGLLFSGGAFYGGYQYLADGHRTGAFLWMLMGAVAALTFSIGAIFSGMHVDGAVVMVAFGFEVLLMRRWLGGKSG